MCLMCQLRFPSVLKIVQTEEAAVRGFHVYKTTWKHQDGELLKCTHEEDNPHDIFSMKVCRPDSDEIVGHLPMEIS